MAGTCIEVSTTFNVTVSLWLSQEMTACHSVGTSPSTFRSPIYLLRILRMGHKVSALSTAIGTSLRLNLNCAPDPPSPRIFSLSSNDASLDAVLAVPSFAHGVYLYLSLDGRHFKHHMSKKYFLR